MWGINLEGITMPAKQEVTRIYRWEDIPVKWAPHSILFIVDDSINHNCHLTRRNHTPYYGFATKMRTRRAHMQVLEVENIVSTIKQLICGRIKGNKLVTDLIDILISEKTTVPLATLLLDTRQVYSGAISH